jgi:hypothetical protein
MNHEQFIYYYPTFELNNLYSLERTTKSRINQSINQYQWLKLIQTTQNLRRILLNNSTLIPKMSSLKIDQAANAGDLFARSILEECATILGLSLSIIIPVIQPEYLIFAGGISKSKIWLDKVKKTIKDNTPNWYEKSDSDKCFLTPDQIKPSFCESSTEVQLLGAVELITNS